MLTYMLVVTQMQSEKGSETKDDGVLSFMWL